MSDQAPVPPHDLDAERDVLAALMSFRSAADPIFALVSPVDFYDHAHREIVAAAEQLWRHGRPTDVPSIGARLSESGSKLDRARLTQIYAYGIGASGVEAAQIVADRAVARQAIDVARELREAGYRADLEAVVDVVAMAEDLRPRGALIEPILTLDEAIVPPPDGLYRWIFPGLLCHRERVAITGGEGAGKMTLLRQLAIAAAAGLDPFRLTRIEAKRVLLLDFEQDRAENAREYSGLHATIRRYGADCEDRFGLVERDFCDLTSRADEAWLRSLTDKFRPDVLVIGPLYKAYQGAKGRKKDSEETAEIVTHVLDKIRSAHQCAILLEGHSPHGDNGDRSGGRLRGSALWQGWPQGVFQIRRLADKAGEAPRASLVKVRPFRDRGRAWPTMIFEGARGQFPWITEDTPPPGYRAGVLEHDETRF